MICSYDMINDLMLKLESGELNGNTVLNQFGIDKLAEEIAGFLQTSMEKQDADTVDSLIYLVYCFDLQSNGLLKIFHELILEKWHYKHEDLARLIGKYKSPSSVPYLKDAAVLQLDYLQYEGDETFAFSRKCIRALRTINTAEANEAICELSKSNRKEIAKIAKQCLPE